MTLPIVISLGDPGHIGHHEEIHELLGRLDGQTDFLTTGVFQDLLASLPAAGASNLGLFRYATDTDRLAYSDGGAWRSLAITELPNTFDDDAYFASGRPWVDVMAFGALGDNATDDVVDMQAAIDSLGVTGGEVFVPKGDFVTSANLDVPANVAVRGTGWGSQVRYTGGGNAFEISGAGTLSRFYVKITGLRITTASGAAGIYLKDCAEVTIANNFINGFSNAAILSDPTVGVNLGVITINVFCNELRANGRGIRTIGANAHNQWTVIGNHIQGNTVGAGIHCEKAANQWTIAGNEIEGNVTNEILFENDVAGVIIHGNYMETNTAANNCIRISGAGVVRGMSVQGNWAQNNGGAAATGRFWYCTSTGTLTGIRVNANAIHSYGALTNPAIDGGAKTYINSDFSGNGYNADVTTTHGAFAAGGAILERRSGRFTSVNFASIPANTTADATGSLSTLSATGFHVVKATPQLRDGVTPIAVLEAGLVASGFVSAANQITIRLANVTTGAIDPIARDYMVEVTTYA